MNWRLLLLDIPALVVKWLFTFYWFYLAVITAITFLMVIATLMAWLAGWPVPWIH